MAYFSRLIFAFIALFVASVSPASAGQGFFWDGPPSTPVATAEQACLPQRWHAAHSFVRIVPQNPSSGSRPSCWFYDPGLNEEYEKGSVGYWECPGNQVVQINGSVNPCVDPPPPPECPENKELDSETNTCVCKTGPAGAFSVSGDVYAGCNNGCAIVLTSGSYSGTTKKTYGYWNQNGNTCAAAPESPGVDPPDSPDGKDAGKCPTGQCPGTVNGQSICVPCKGKESSDSSSSENTTQTPNGASAPSGSTSESSSGSKSTECEGGVCVTKEKVVVTNPDGSTTEKEKETTESLSEFCAKNPKAAICKATEESTWGGACAGGFQCKGDAVQCAQAQASWQAACALDTSGMTEAIQAGNAAMAAGAASGLGLPNHGDSFNLASKISETPLFAGSGGCPGDYSLSVSGRTYLIPFSKMCPSLNILGNALMAFSYFVAAVIVFRGGTQ